jgi:hypothetical protein
VQCRRAELSIGMACAGGNVIEAHENAGQFKEP